MTKEEILKFIKESKNLKLDLKKALTDEKFNFNWNDFFNLYYFYFGKRRNSELTYVSGSEEKKMDNYSLKKIRLKSNNEMEIIPESSSSISYTAISDSLMKNLKLLFEMFKSLNEKTNKIEKEINDFFCDNNDEVNSENNFEKLKNVDNELV